MMGDDPKKAAQKLEEAGANLVGHNCGGATPEETTAILKEMREVTDLPLVSKPNAGLPESVDGKLSYPATPETYATESLKWVEAGARVVGGCCGTEPEHTRQIFIALKGRTL
jgi:5-methyltetrahydrofolate--homocysteine methyltransferase